MSDQKFWFTAKKSGMGWYPLCTEGWVVLAAFIAATVVPVAALVSGRLSAGMYLVYTAVLSAALVWVIHKKGER
jgi:hypothetical protein